VLVLEVEIPKRLTVLVSGAEADLCSSTDQGGGKQRADDHLIRK
jgi:hypothetical protein